MRLTVVGLSRAESQQSLDIARFYVCASSSKLKICPVSAAAAAAAAQSRGVDEKGYHHHSRRPPLPPSSSHQKREHEFSTSKNIS